MMKITLKISPADECSLREMATEQGYDTLEPYLQEHITFQASVWRLTYRERAATLLCSRCGVYQITIDSGHKCLQCGKQLTKKGDPYISRRRRDLGLGPVKKAVTA